MKTTEFQAQDALRAFVAFCEDHGVACADSKVSPSQTAGADYCLGWDVESQGAQGAIMLGYGVVGMREGKVVSASFEPTGRAFSAAFVGADAQGQQAAEQANALALAFKLWPRDGALAESEGRSRLARKLEERRERPAHSAKPGPR